MLDHRVSPPVDRLDAPVALGIAVRQGRLRLGYSQESFADLLGMHRTQLGHIEQGKKDCRLSTIVRIATSLGMPASRLLAEAEMAVGGS